MVAKCALESVIEQIVRFLVPLQVGLRVANAAELLARRIVGKARSAGLRANAAGPKERSRVQLGAAHEHGVERQAVYSRSPSLRLHVVQSSHVPVWGRVHPACNPRCSARGCDPALRSSRWRSTRSSLRCSRCPLTFRSGTLTTGTFVGHWKGCRTRTTYLKPICISRCCPCSLQYALRAYTAPQTAQHRKHSVFYT